MNQHEKINIFQTMNVGVASVNSGLGSEGALDLDRKVGKGQDSEEYGEVCVGGGHS